MLKLKRAYDPPSKEDGKRFLVERLWPRGMRKSALQLEAWLKEVAPSTELRQWFSHDPAKWNEFQKRYRSELKQHPQVYGLILSAAQGGTVTLVYGSRESKYNCATVLRDFLKKKLAGKQNSTRTSAA